MSAHEAVSARAITYENTSRTARAGALTLHYHEAGPRTARS